MPLDDLDIKDQRLVFHKVENLFFSIGGLFALLSFVLFSADVKFYLNNTNNDFFIWKAGLSICLLFVGLGLFYKFTHEILKIPTPKKLAYFHFIFSQLFIFGCILLYVDFHFDMQETLSTRGIDAAGDLLEDANILLTLIVLFIFIQCLFLPIIYISSPSRHSI